MNKLKVAIVGFGRMGVTHFSIINTNPSVEVSAVADTSTTTLSLLKKYVDNVETYSDYKTLLSQERLDAIVVCTPPKLHYDIALMAAREGIHVFCEKPFTTNAKHAGELAAAFEQKNLVGQVGYVNRFNDVFQRVRQLLEADAIGNVVNFKSEMYSSTITKKHRESNWRGTREEGGGALFEMASHAIDLVHFLVGPPDKITGSHLSAVFSEHVEDAVMATFLYENGSSGSINVNWSDSSYRKPANRIELLGPKGKIIADQHGLKIFLNEDRADLNLARGWSTKSITDLFVPVPFYVRGNEFTAQLYHFVSCIIDRNVRCSSSFADGASTMRAIEGIYEDYTSNGRL